VDEADGEDLYCAVVESVPRGEVEEAADRDGDDDAQIEESGGSSNMDRLYCEVVQILPTGQDDEGDAAAAVDDAAVGAGVVGVGAAAAAEEGSVVAGVDGDDGAVVGVEGVVRCDYAPLLSPGGNNSSGSSSRDGPRIPVGSPWHDADDIASAWEGGRRHVVLQ